MGALPIAVLLALALQGQGQDTYTIRGTVVVQADGEHVPESGWIEFALDSMHWARGRVENGRWTAEIPAWLEVMSVCRMELDGRPAHAAPTHFWFSSYGRGGRNYEIKARWTPRTILRAVDSVTRQPVSEIEVVLDIKTRGLTAVRDRPPGRPGEKRDNPSEISAWSERDLALGWTDERWWWVRAQGYDWTLLQVDHSVGGEVVVGLRSLVASAYDHTTQGRIVVLDGSERYVPRTGWIRFDMDNMQPSQTVAVVDGEWSLPHPDWIGVMAIEDMLLDGRTAHCPSDRFVKWEETEHGIEARWTPMTLMRAVDAQTGAEIPELEVFCENEFNRGLLMPNPSEQRELRPTPVRISAWNPEDGGMGWRFVSERAWWVRAPGYAWKQVEVDHSRGGLMRVKLARGGAIEINLRGENADRILNIRLNRSDNGRSGRWFVWDRAAPMRIEGLQAGTYSVGGWRYDKRESSPDLHHRRLAWVTVEVRPGLTTRVELNAD